MENHSNKSFYDRISRYYDGISHASERAATEDGWRLLDVQPDERILEIGFGTGFSLVEFAAKVGETGHVTGVDVSSGMREVAAERLGESGLEDRVTLDIAAVPPLCYADDSFDGVFLSFTLELFPLEQIPVVLVEIRRVLKPGGRCAVVCMAEPEDGEHESMLEGAYKWMHRHFPHFVDCQPIAVEALLEESGFQVGDIVRLEIWSLPVLVVATRSYLPG